MLFRSLYIKMLLDQGVAARTNVKPWAGTLIERQISNFEAILRAYQSNLPKEGTVYNLAAARDAYCPGGWDFTCSMYLLCYLNAADQTDAVLNMCSVTNQAVFLHCGEVPSQARILSYDRNRIRNSFHGCEIEEKDEWTHHIRMATSAAAAAAR